MIFQIPICVFFEVFIVFRTTDWLQYEKEETRAQFSSQVCVSACAPNLVWFFSSLFFSDRRFYDYWALALAQIPTDLLSFIYLFLKTLDVYLMFISHLFFQFYF